MNYENKQAICLSDIGFELRSDLYVIFISYAFSYSICRENNLFPGLGVITNTRECA